VRPTPWTRLALDLALIAVLSIATWKLLVAVFGESVGFPLAVLAAVAIGWGVPWLQEHS